jgi:type IV pilus assembly protein PilM
MARSFPPDVIALDTDGMLHARLRRGNKSPQIERAKTYRLPEGTFTAGVVTPTLTNEQALTEAVRRLRLEAGKIDKVSLLLPDSWFRMNILDLPSLPDRTSEADEVVRWSLKRTLPIEPDTLRISYEFLGKTLNGVRVLVISAVNQTLTALEKVFASAGVEVVLVESIGLNIWNAVAVKEPETNKDRVFLYVRDTDFTTAVFRGSQPLFLRSRNFSGERTLQQEIRLSASYLRETLQASGVEQCYLAGNQITTELVDALKGEFGAPVRTLHLRDLVEQVPADVTGFDSELAACTGVFTG